jgi:hypothetical protein
MVSHCVRIGSNASGELHDLCQLMWLIKTSAEKYLYSPHVWVQHAELAEAPLEDEHPGACGLRESCCRGDPSETPVARTTAWAARPDGLHQLRWSREKSAAWPETATAAMTGEVGEGVALTLDAAVRALRDEERLPGTEDLVRSVDGYGTGAGNSDQ